MKFEHISRRPFFSVVLTALMLSVGVPVVVGPSPVTAQERDLQKAKEKFLEGKDLYDDEKYLEAADAFLEAHEQSGRSELLYNIGQAYRLAGKLEEAEKYFQRYLEEMPDAPNADAVVETIIELQQQIAARMASVQVITDVEGREVFIGDEDEARCQSPCTVSLSPGDYELRVTGDRSKPQVRDISLEPTQKLTLEIALEKKIVPGRLVLYTDRPGGRLRVGTDIDAALPMQRPLELNPGDYPVEVEASRDVKWRGQVRIEPEQTTQVMVPMQPLVEARRRNSVWKKVSYGLWGLSAAFATGGLVMGMQTQDTYDLLVAQRANRNIDPGLIDEGEDQQLAANVMYGLGAVSVASGIGLYLWDEWSADEEAQRPEPRPSDTLSPGTGAHEGEAEDEEPSADEPPAGESEAAEPADEPADEDEPEGEESSDEEPAEIDLL